jgi:hypothetical protein
VRGLLSAIALCGWGWGAQAAPWKLEQRTDAITDDVVKYASIQSRSGDTATIIRKSGGEVWMYVRLRPAALFSTEQRLAARVDKHEAYSWSKREDDAMKGILPPSFDWSPSLIGVRLWHGKAEEGCGFVGQLAKGRLLVVRHYPQEATVQDVMFDLPKDSGPLMRSLDLRPSDCR